MGAGCEQPKSRDKRGLRSQLCQPKPARPPGRSEVNQRGGAQRGAATAALKSGRITEAQELNTASGRLLCPKARMRRDGNKSGQMWPKSAITEAAKVVCGVVSNATQQKML